MDRIRRFIVVHRRPIAAALAALAVLTALQSLKAAPPTVTVVVAARDLSSGEVLRPGDLVTRQYAIDTRPAGLLDLDVAVGRRVAGPMRQGEPITDRRVLAMRDTADGDTLTMVPLADPSVTVGLRVGDVVDVIASASDESGAGVVVAARAVVVVLPDTAEGVAAPTIGVGTDHETAVRLASRALDSRLTLVIAP